MCVRCCTVLRQHSVVQRRNEYLRWLHQQGIEFVRGACSGPQKKKEEMIKRFRDFIRWFSAEWMLDRFGTNGGDAIIARAIWITGWVFVIAIALQAGVDPDRTVFSLKALRGQVIDVAPWTSAVFGGVYLALYARFSSQWSYLAGVYNQIKQAESTLNLSQSSQPPVPQSPQGAQAGQAPQALPMPGTTNVALAAWKAGIIEDAENLHLACKASIAPIIHAWAAQSEIAGAFVQDVPGGQIRLDRLKAKVKSAYDAVAARYP